jgi:probable rRNA maturation factor
MPSRATLARAFEAAWKLVPRARRPDPLGKGAIALDLLIVPDREISELNVAHLKVRGPTDVLSFPMGEVDPERKAYNLGEIVVSHETAAREAAARKLPRDEELCRYCVHGFLHLLGYEDTTAAQRKAMFVVQEKALKRMR